MIQQKGGGSQRVGVNSNRGSAVKESSSSVQKKATTQRSNKAYSNAHGNVVRLKIADASEHLRQKEEGMVGGGEVTGKHANSFLGNKSQPITVTNQQRPQKSG